MLTHGTDGKHKVKAHKMMRGAGYGVKRSMGGLSKAEKSEPATKGQIVKAIDQHDDQLHHGKRTTVKLKSGGVAAEEKSAHRPDKKPRLASGGKSGRGAHTKINIMVAPGKSDSPAAPMSLPSPAMPAPQMPPRPPIAPGIAPPMMSPGMKPPNMKAGGRMKPGHYEAGAGSGVGREEKVKNYKKSVKKD